MSDLPDYTNSMMIVGVTIESIPISIVAQEIDTLSIDIAAQSVGNLNVNITNATITVNGAVTITSGTVNIQTEGGLNILIDKLTIDAYIERRSTLSNSGTGGGGGALTSVQRTGKFFPRGCRGFIQYITIRASDNYSGGVVTVYLAPFPTATAVYSATINLPSPAAMNDYTATFNKMWNYDSLFIYAKTNNGDVILYTNVTGGDFDGWFTSDSGVTWIAQNNLPVFTAVMQAQTIGDLPISGWVNIQAIDTGVILGVTIAASDVTLDVNITNASLTVTGTVAISGTVTVSGTVAISGSVTVTGSVTVSGTVAISGTVTVSGAVTVTGSVTVSGTIAVSGTVTVTGSVTVSGTVTISGTVNVNISSSDVTLSTVITDPTVLVNFEGTALNFDGVNDYVEVADAASLKPNVLTVVATVTLPSDINSYDSIVLSKGYQPLTLGAENNATPKAHAVIKRTGEGETGISGIAMLPLGTQTNIIYDYDGRYFHIYINGVLDKTYDFGSVNTIEWTTNSILICKNVFGGISRGILKSLRYYNRILTAGEKSVLNSDLYAIIPNGLVLYFTFDEGAGTTVYDKSGLANNGTVYGATWVASTITRLQAVNVNVANESRFKYAHCAADTQVKAVEGRIHTVTINKCTTAGTVTIYDNTAESGTVIAVINLALNMTPITLIYDVLCTTGIYIGFDGTVVADLTVSYV